MKENTRKRLRILIPSFRFPLAERKENGKEKITILLCYSKHVKISFHYVLNAPCAYYAFLISRTKRGKQQPDREDGSENSAAQRNVIYFLGNENENVSQRTRYTLSFGL
jgi:hypothetical protein